MGIERWTTRKGWQAAKAAKESIRDDLRLGASEHPKTVVNPSGFYYPSQLADFASDMVTLHREKKNLTEAAVYRTAEKELREGTYPTKLPGQAFWDIISRLKYKSNIANTKRAQKSEHEREAA